MPRYFFHVRDGLERPDQEGTELPGLVAARTEALMVAGRLIMDAAARADLGEEWRITVTDEADLILFIMTFLVAEAPATGRQNRG